MAGRHPRNVADEQADQQVLRLIDADLPACPTRSMHGSHLSPRLNCMIVARAHVRKPIPPRGDRDEGEERPPAPQTLPHTGRSADGYATPGSTV